jgi:hypothetical protein
LFGFVDINDVSKSPRIPFTGIVENLLNSSKETLSIAGYAVKKY